MKFSKLFEAVEPPQRLFHLTPSGNVESILQKGLIRGSRRSTNGVETQQKIYVMSRLENIPNPFPHHEFWNDKSFSVLEVDPIALTQYEKLELDPEYDEPVFFMYNADIPPNALKDLGRHRFQQVGPDTFTGQPLIGDREYARKQFQRRQA